MYARYTLMQMVSLGYQARTGICTAGHYGVPQVRPRPGAPAARAGAALHCMRAGRAARACVLACSAPTKGGGAHQGQAPAARSTPAPSHRVRTLSTSPRVRPKRSPAQGRRRALFWGAASGVEQLPPFPEATHHVKPFNTPYPGSAEACKVEFLSAVSGRHGTAGLWLAAPAGARVRVRERAVSACATAPPLDAPLAAAARRVGWRVALAGLRCAGADLPHQQAPRRCPSMLLRRPAARSARPLPTRWR